MEALGFVTFFVVVIGGIIKIVKDISKESSLNRRVDQISRENDEEMKKWM